MNHMDSMTLDNKISLKIEEFPPNNLNHNDFASEALHT